MPVHLETTSAISSSVTLLRTSGGAFSSARLRRCRRFSSSGMLAVLQLRHACQVAGAARLLELQARALEFLADLRRALERGLLGLPDLLEVGVLLLEPGERLLQASPGALEASSFSFFSASCSIFSWMMRRSSWSSASGLESISMRMRAAASSIRSMALSGSWRSVM